MNILIVGNGAWGKAVSTLFLENGHVTSFWQEGEKIPDNAIVFSAIPTQFIREVYLTVGKPSNTTFINGSKGIEKNTHELPYEIVTGILDKPNYFTLMGPSFAEEVIKKMPTLVNLGYRDEEKAQEVKELFQTDYFRVKITRGIRSLELAAAFKNIYAIACGVADGLGYGMNTRVKIMCLAMDEFNKLRTKLDYKIDDEAIPATIGDLILTCSSEESRNFTFGKLLVAHTPEESLTLARGTVEGYHTVGSVPYFQKETGVGLPLARFVYDITHSASSGNIKARFTNFVKTT